ncbi:PLDc N-terminal domain-containing protein [Salegentibacter maritimus]|uniref:PLDc N-terminal domain-containing protein n=1 Tax=Salegentibacter maritimus TaxID=2794347 RepID=UPI0018E48EA5|nr:PLD nuclease N-terminal domain-containing protein [Salegentibacter maritimus]MBI6118349.1 PLDc_N domain-containing protein [Salegentibacter maritimus]
MTTLAIGAPQLVLILCVFLTPLIAIVDIVRNEFTGNNKLIWILIVFFFNFFGVILYFLIGRKQRIKKTA